MPGTLVFDYPTVAAIAAYVTDIMAPASPTVSSTEGHGHNPPPAAMQLAEPSHPSQQAVLLTDMRARLPEQPGLQAATSAGFAGQAAASLAQAVDPIQPVPLDRWDVDFGRSVSQLGAQQSRVPGGLGVRFGGFMLEWATFDPEAFSISPSGDHAAWKSGWW